MSLPKEPRQLMINLMYLVLTALLAMNVSSEISNAFKIMDKSLIRSNKVAEDRNKGVTDLFGKYAEDPKVNAEKKKKVEDAFKLADEVNTKTTAMVSQLENFKKLIIDASGGFDKTGELKQIEYLDGGTRVMIEEGNGPKLLASLQKYKNEMAGLVPIDDKVMIGAGVNNNPEIFKLLPLDFSTDKSENNPDGDWSYGNFHMSPTIANVALLNKYINDVRACQSVALDNIWALATGEKDNRVRMTPKIWTDYAIIVSADNSYLLPGEKYHARVAMGTYNKKLKNLSFQIDGSTYYPNEEGVVEFTQTPSANGPKTYNVTAVFNDSILNLDGTKSLKQVKTVLPKPIQYFVGEATASISLDKMNVFYIGVDNPISLSASGIPADRVVAVGEGCTLKSTGVTGKYIVTAEKSTTAYITLSGTKADGSPITFGKYPYRVKYLPDPVCYFANKRSGKIGVGEAQAQLGLIARLEGSDFDAKFNVVSFDIYHHPRRGEDQSESSTSLYTNGAKANAQIKAVIDKLDVGSKLYFDNVKAVGPDKKVRNLGSMVFILAY